MAVLAVDTTYVLSPQRLSFATRCRIVLSCLFSKMPEKESDHLTPATRLLEKRREMAEVETALSQQKEVINC